MHRGRFTVNSIWVLIMHFKDIGGINQALSDIFPDSEILDS